MKLLPTRCDRSPSSMEVKRQRPKRPCSKPAKKNSMVRRDSIRTSLGGANIFTPSPVRWNEAGLAVWSRPSADRASMWGFNPTGHSVKPSRVVEYKALIEEYYDKLAKDKQFDVKLTGSWEVVIGNLDTFCRFA